MPGTLCQVCVSCPAAWGNLRKRFQGIESVEAIARVAMLNSIMCIMIVILERRYYERKNVTTNNYDINDESISYRASHSVGIDRSSLLMK